MRHVILAAAVVAIGTVVWVQGPIPQPLDYHVMADQRAYLGVANCLNVLSNIPFAIVGVLGLSKIFAATPWPTRLEERRAYATLFIGVSATAVGSSYYHLAPDNARLVWDRLPMTLGFMGLLTAIVAERVSPLAARRMLLPSIAFGAGSVLYWYWTELRGSGDLRLYLLVQFGSLVAVVLLLVLYPSRHRGTSYLVVGLVAYAAAKLFESADRAIFDWGHVISGHTIKHLSAAAGAACVAYMLRQRAERGLPPDHVRAG